MRNFKVLAVVLVLAVGVGCKKKRADDGGGTAGGGSAGARVAVADAATETPDAAPVEPPKAIVTMTFADMKWVPLDEKAGDQGPMVVWLWGEAMKEPGGFLIKVPPANKGMWHTHSHDYHGVSLMGSVNHLQDGETKAKPLPPGSYWLEPAGAVHNSQCLGKEPCVGLIQFTEGKFDFAPAESKKGGKPDPKHVEKREKDLKWAPVVPEAGDKGPMFASLWGDNASGPSGFFFKMPAGMASPPHTHTSDYHAVAVKGTFMNHEVGDKAPKELTPGSYWMQPGGAAHVTACKAGAECVGYVYMTGKMDLKMVDDAGGAAGSAAAGSAAAGSAAAGSADMKK